MLRLAADKNFNNDIVRGLIRRKPGIDLVRIQDPGLSGAHDSEVLEWAVQQGHVLLTHDVSTMTRFAYERVEAGLAMSGVFEVNRRLPIVEMIDELLLLVECSLEAEWEVQVRYLPLR